MSDRPQAATILLPRVDLGRPRESEGDESPLERLQRCGARCLSDAELLALVLRLDRPGEAELEDVRDLLRTIGLDGVARLDETFLYSSVWEEGASASVLAAVELARRLARIRLPERRLFDKMAVTADYLTLRYQCGQELMGVLFLDARMGLFAEREIFRGTLRRAAVAPRDILKLVLMHGAASFIVFHCHPSGDPTPSDDDLDFTRRLAVAAEAVGVGLHDHLILGLGGRWVSLRARGELG